MCCVEIILINTRENMHNRIMADMKITVTYPKLTEKEKKRLSAEITKKLLEIIKKS